MSGLSNKSSAEPNLTPILDMVFQLITFFMLVTNFKNNLIDKNMELPVVGTARSVDPGGELLQLLVNLNGKHEFTVGSRVIPKDEIVPWIKTTAHQSRMTERRIGRIKEDTDDLTTEVIVRADKGTSFRDLNVVINALQGEGFRRFAFRAMEKARDK